VHQLMGNLMNQGLCPRMRRQQDGPAHAHALDVTSKLLNLDSDAFAIGELDELLLKQSILSWAFPPAPGRRKLRPGCSNDFLPGDSFARLSKLTLLTTNLKTITTIIMSAAKLCTFQFFVLYSLLHNEEKGMAKVPALWKDRDG
jgi:hypothetical protein